MTSSIRMMFTLLSCLLTPVDHVSSDKTSQMILPPLHVCSGDMLSSNEMIALCPELCEFNWNLDSPVSYYVFNLVSTQTIWIIDCTLHQDRIFSSESYLWSRDHRLLSTTKVLPNPERCSNLAKTHCLSLPCSYTEEIPEPEYKWGAELTNSYERYSLTSAAEVITVYDGIAPQLMIGNHRVNIEEGIVSDIESKSYKMWNKDSVINNKVCPFSQYKPVLMYVHLSKPNLLWAADLGISLHLKGNAFKDFRCFHPGHSDLLDLQMTEEGVVIAKAKDGERKDKPISQVYVAGKIEEGDKLVIKGINSLELMKAKELCLISCYGSESKGLHILGGGAIYTNNHQKSIFCSHFSTPKALLPTQICTSPSIKLRVLSSQTIYWWSPESPILNASDTCDKFLGKLPRREIRSGPMIINSSGVFLHRPSVVKTLHPSAFSEIHMANYIKMGETSKLAYEHIYGSHTSFSVVSHHTQEEEHDGFFSDFCREVRKFKDSVYQSISSIGDLARVIGLVVVIVLILWGLSIFIRAIYKIKSLSSPRSSGYSGVPKSRDVSQRDEIPMREIN